MYVSVYVRKKHVWKNVKVISHYGLHDRIQTADVCSRKMSLFHFLQLALDFARIRYEQKGT